MRKEKQAFPNLLKTDKINNLFLKILLSTYVEKNKKIIKAIIEGKKSVVVYLCSRSFFYIQ